MGLQTLGFEFGKFFFQLINLAVLIMFLAIPFWIYKKIKALDNRIEQISDKLDKLISAREPKK
ncbi:MAG: hypothetical protein CVV03_03700 [Firmicutes bacterium HGW-Firmicutes-8]|nr:MAG: hypothetical protein CVV03_03700 [Firmicutes bacterium HGW-Firmicutes-8]